MEQQNLKQLFPTEQTEVLQILEYISAGQPGGSRPQSGSCRKGKKIQLHDGFQPPGHGSPACAVVEVAGDGKENRHGNGAGGSKERTNTAGEGNVYQDNCQRGHELEAVHGLIAGG